MLYNFVLDFPNDTGPIYQETVEGQIPVEPFNTFSNLIFLGILIYFWLKIKKNPKQHPFFLFALPLTFIGWVGGTVYHGTRSHQAWLVMDWMPIMLICLGGIIYFITKITQRWWLRVLIFLGLLAFSFLPRQIPLPDEFRISFGYTIIALTVLTPFVWYAYQTHWRNIHLIILGAVFFGVAVTFRTLDNTMVVFPMGTHWLWHTFGGCAVFCILLYTFKDKQHLL